MTSKSGTLGKRQGGVAAVEFAIVAPLCLFVMLSVSEFGRAILQYNTLTRAVRDAARYAASEAIQGQSGVVRVDTDLVSAVGNVAAFGTAAGTSESLLPGLAPTDFIVTDEGGGVISVTGTYNYQPLFGAVLPQTIQRGAIRSAFTMRAQITMRALG